MCCFSGPVEEVSGTKIFGRVDGGWQYIVYEMSFSAAEEVAMVLPIPVTPGSGEQAVRFINFEDYPDFFDDLDALFPRGEAPAAAALSLGDLMSTPAQVLEVQEVGAFEASFVPTIADFVRLDPRFRLPEGIWSELGDYQYFGFAVFKLAAGRSQHVHPMAFSFPTRDPKTVFFPTVHVHDGKVHAEAEFNHQLYCQADAALTWQESEGVASRGVDMAKVQGVVSIEGKCFRRFLYGLRDNADHCRAA